VPPRDDLIISFVIGRDDNLDLFTKAVDEGELGQLADGPFDVDREAADSVRESKAGQVGPMNESACLAYDLVVFLDPQFVWRRASFDIKTPAMDAGIGLATFNPINNTNNLCFRHRTVVYPPTGDEAVSQQC
jgi:hypothetical protein